MPPTTVPTHIARRGGAPSGGTSFSAVPVTVPRHILAARDNGARRGRGGTPVSTNAPTETQTPGRSRGGKIARGTHGGRGGITQPTPEVPTVPEEPTPATPRRGRGRPRGATATPVENAPNIPVKKVIPVTKATLDDQKEAEQPKVATPKKTAAKKVAEPTPKQPRPTSKAVKVAPDPDPPKAKRGRKRKATEEAEGAGRTAPAPPQTRPIARPRELEIAMEDAKMAGTRVVGGRALRARKPTKK